MTAEHIYDTRNPDINPVNPETLSPLGFQLSNYMRYFYSHFELTPESSDFYPDTDNIKAEIERKAFERGLEIVARNNVVAEIISSPEYREIHERQMQQKGKCALGVSECIDGRIPRIHLWGLTAGVQESLAGVLSTYQSPIDGRTKLRSQTLEQSVAARPAADFSQLLEVCMAHGDCGAMKMWAKEAIAQGTPFETDDLVAVNFDLFETGIEAITRKYNNAATSQEKPPLKKVGIKLYYDTDAMGLTLDPADPNGNSVSTTETARKLRREFSQYDSKYKDDFDSLERLLEKERDLTDLVDLLFENDRFNSIVLKSLQKSQELQDLNPEQQQAYKYIWARFTGLQILTGTYKGILDQEPDHVHVEQPFAHHEEEYMSITVDDGLNVIVGQFDPEVQVFGATVCNSDDAVEHITTEDMLMDNREDTKPPRMLFISSAMAEDSEDPASVKKARANVAKSFREIIENPRMIDLIKSGKIVPIPVIIKNRSAQIVEIPNLAL